MGVDNYKEFLNAMQMVESMFIIPLPPVITESKETVVEEVNHGFSNLLDDLACITESVDGLLQEVHYTDLFGAEFEKFRKKYSKDMSGKYVQFTNFSTGDTLEKNPYENPNHSDPVGIYGYPMSYVIKNPADVWYGQKAKFLRVLQDKSKRKLYLQNKSKDDLQNIIQSMFHWRNSEVEARWAEARKLYKQRIGTGVGADARTFMQVIQMDWYSKPEYKNEAYLRTGKEQTALFRQAGYDAVEDTAKSGKQAAINSREPEQVIFLHRGAFDVVEVFNLPQKERDGTSVGTSDDPEHLTRKWAAQIATAMGDVLTSDKGDRTGRVGWEFFWTKGGKQIEIRFDRPEEYYVGKKMGEKKHKEVKLSSSWKPQIKIRTPKGGINVSGYDDTELKRILAIVSDQWNDIKNDEDREEKYSKSGTEAKEKAARDAAIAKRNEEEYAKNLKNFDHYFWDDLEFLSKHYHMPIKKPTTDEAKVDLYTILDKFTTNGRMRGYENAKNIMGKWPSFHDYDDVWRLVDKAVGDAKSEEGRKFHSPSWLRRDIEEKGTQESRLIDFDGILEEIENWECIQEVEKKNSNSSLDNSDYSDKNNRRTHHPKPLPRDCVVVQKGKRVGTDVAGRHVFEFNGYYWSWDRQEGEWEVFSMQRVHLKVVSPDGRLIKDRVKGRILKFRGDK